MVNFKVLALVFSGAVVAACASQPEQQQVAYNDEDVPVVVCKKEAPTGSNMKEMVCRSYTKGTAADTIDDINTINRMRDWANEQRPNER